MTTVTFRSRGNEYYIKINGHAGFNPGNDPLCAAQSILAYTLSQIILIEKQAGTFPKCEYDVNEKDGMMRVKVQVLPDAIPRIDSAVSVIAVGFSLLQEQYPEYVKVKLDFEDEPIAHIESHAVN